MADSGKREKMVIEAYEKPDFTSKVSDYTFQLNPESYDRSVVQGVKEDTQRLSSGESAPANKAADQECLTLTFYIDSTGVVPGCTDVLANIASLRKLGLDVNGTIHRSNYLKVRWGADFLFCCVMVDLKTDFMLFKPDGTPVRAKLIAKFKQFTDPATKAKENNNSSPDLTHIKTVVDGDNLPMLCYKVYGDSRYYIQVAEYNGLIDFNTLVPNQRIIFPRLTHD